VLHDELDRRSCACSASQRAGAQRRQTILTGPPDRHLRENNRTSVIARQPLEERSRLSDLRDAYMPTVGGQYVPFSQFAPLSGVRDG